MFVLLFPHDQMNKIKQPLLAISTVVGMLIMAPHQETTELCEHEMG
jgi:hypothetical protein